MPTSENIRLLPLLLLSAPLALAGPARALPQDPPAPAPVSEDARIRDIEARLAALQQELAALKASSAAGEQQKDQQIEALSAELDAVKSGAAGGDHWYDRFTLGGYGQMQYSAAENAPELVDPDRFVVYLGYRFSDWLRLYSETEIEGGFVEGDQGEIALEQFYLDFAFDPAASMRIGRVLAPLGIVNQRHEPTQYYGVNRPSVERFIIPSTWWTDAIGAYGEISPGFAYQAYVGSSFNGAGFTSLEGIREGRQEGIAVLDQPGFSGRLDWYPEMAAEQSLRVGVGLFGGGVDNGGGTHGTLGIYSADCQYSIGRLDVRGLYAWESISNAGGISNVVGEGIASAIFGWYLEAGYHVMPDDWRTGILERSDAIAFVRYDDYDTQHEMPSGFSADPAGNRNDWTFGLGFYPVPNVVLKMDYEIFDDATGNDLGGAFNVGFGFTL